MVYSPISGAEFNPMAVIAWGIITGYVFSTVGAAGAILTFIGQVVVFKLDKFMLKHLPTAGYTEAQAKTLTKNTLKVHNLAAVIMSPLIAVPTYFKERRVALPLAGAVAVGVVLGALVGPAIPMTLKQYKIYFGVITFIIGIRLAYETTERYRAGKAKLKAISERFEAKVKELKASGEMDEIKKEGFKVTSFTPTTLRFTFWGEEFNINPIIAAVGGFFIAVLASMLGLGGGFLLVPYLASVFVLPMFIVAGTSITIVLINSLVAIARYFQKGALFDYYYMSLFLLGIIGGSLLGPKLQKYYKEKYLRWLLAIILLFYGLRFMGVWKALGLPI